jgi:phosphoribosylformimino-5-aminoimidazole carboxamide ribotide isomerase
MEIIPVLDLKGGVVVHARMGLRNAYRPIETPLSPNSRPIDVARGLLSIYPFASFYIADLDSIEGKGDNDAVLIELRLAFPDLALWVDKGLAELASADRWLGAGLGHLILGSETQRTGGLVQHFRQDERVILSLDYRDDVFVGPSALLHNSDSWPSKVIVMTLARVGSATGPDMDRLTEIKALAADKRVFAAGGVRNADDLATLAQAGIAGALVATSLHNGAVTGAQIARLQKHRAQTSGGQAAANGCLT